MFARQAEVFAAYVAYSDYEIGRVIQAVEDMGKLDNTLIIYIEGDNGTSAEGSTIGTPFDWAAIQGVNIPVADQLKYYDVWGSHVTEPHMSVAWSWAFDTPFKWTKQVASHFGGTRQGMAISWPAKIKDVGTTRSQFHHVIDIVPTILEATGIEQPTMVNGIEQKPIEGVSMAYTWDKANNNAPSTRKTQYFEMFGNRAIYHDGWIACTTPDEAPWLMGLVKQTDDVMNGYNWELYNLNEDFSEYNDLAKKMPKKLEEMKQLFTMEAATYGVFPLSNSSATRALEPRPSATAGKTEFVYTDVMVGIPGGSAPNTVGKSYTITAEVVLDKNAEGVVVTRGGRFGGYGLYFLKGKPVFTYNFLAISKYKCEGKEALKEGKHTLVFDFKYDGGGAGKGGTGTLSVDGKVVATTKIEHTIPFMNVVDESFDIGNDTRTPVDPDDYSIPFKFTGELTQLTVNLKP
jgi:arylsulfatase